jgi:hypothetical protein
LSELRPFFADIRVEHLNLLAMGKRALRGRFQRVWARLLMRAMESLDARLLAVAPPLRNWCGEAIITGRRV